MNNNPTSEGDAKRQHLEFIQNVITRMNGNSFLIKGWAITLVSAALALVASTHNLWFSIVAISPILLFWYLDSLYLQMEKKYRDLFKEVASDNPTFGSYEMNHEHSALLPKPENKLWKILKSKTIGPFYLLLFLATTATIVILTCSDGTNGTPTSIQVSKPIEIKINDTLINKAISIPNHAFGDTSTRHATIPSK